MAGLKLRVAELLANAALIACIAAFPAGGIATAGSGSSSSSGSGGGGGHGGPPIKGGIEGSGRVGTFRDPWTGERITIKFADPNDPSPRHYEKDPNNPGNKFDSYDKVDYRIERSWGSYDIVITSTTKDGATANWGDGVHASITMAPGPTGPGPD